MMDGQGGEGQVGGGGGGRVGGGEPLTLPTKTPSPPTTTTTTTTSVNGTTEPGVLSPDSAIGVTPTTPTTEAIDKGRGIREDSLEKTKSEDTSISEEGYEEDDEGMEVELSDDDSEEVVMTASMQFPLSKSAPPQHPAPSPLEGGEGGLGVTIKIDSSALLKDASPSGCESDIEDNEETEEEEEEFEEEENMEKIIKKPQTATATTTTTTATTTATTATTITPPPSSPTAPAPAPAPAPPLAPAPESKPTPEPTPEKPQNSPQHIDEPQIASCPAPKTTTQVLNAPQEVPRPGLNAPETPEHTAPAGSETSKSPQVNDSSVNETKTAPPQASPAPEAKGAEVEGEGVVHLPDTVTRLDTPDGAAVYLVGTAHFSRESQEDVANTIRVVKPDVVVVELCKARTAILQLDEDTILHESRTLDLKKVQMIMRQHGKIQGVLYLLLLSVSAHITKQLGMAPGGEFRTAFAEARRSAPGCVIQLGDRPIQVTLSRALASLSLWHKVKLTWHILTSKEPISKEEVEKCKQRDFILEMLAEMTGQFPTISEVFVKERDFYLCRSLQAAAHTPPGLAPRVVVGVVGIGHVPGIVERWGTVTDAEIAAIMRIPPPTLSSRILKTSAKLSFYALISYGVYRWMLPRSAQSALTSAVSSISSSTSSALTSALRNVTPTSPVSSYLAGLFGK